MTRKAVRRREKRRRHRRLPPGTPPGTLNVDPHAPHPVIGVMAYGPDGVFEDRAASLAGLAELRKAWPITWVNVDGLGDVEVIRKLGDVFGLHTLALEDVVHVHQRAKVEQYKNYLFLVLRCFELRDHLETEQISLFLGKDFVITFQERAGDSFDPVRQRVRDGTSRIRETGPDFLAYALMDAVIDSYFPMIEILGERLDALEDETILRPQLSTVAAIHEIRRDLLTLRRAIWPLRDAINTCLREIVNFISDETRVYLRDCYDHTFQVIDLLETYREVGSGLMETYLSSVGNRTNEVMKVLTIIATIFIPLTFIAGVYGMNFKTERSPLNMPELTWYWGYPFCLALMAVISLGLLLFFWRRGWLGRRASAPTQETAWTSNDEPGRD